MKIKYLLSCPDNEQFLMTFDARTSEVIFGGRKRDLPELSTLLSDYLNLCLDECTYLHSATNKRKLSLGAVNAEDIFSAIGKMRDNGIIVEKVNSVGRMFN